MLAQPGRHGDDGVSSAPTMSQSLGSCPTAGGSNQLTDRLRWAILPLQLGLRWNRWFRPGGRPSELLSKFRSVQRQLSPAADKPSHMLLPASCQEATSALPTKAHSRARAIKVSCAGQLFDNPQSLPCSSQQSGVQVSIMHVPHELAIWHAAKLCFPIINWFHVLNVEITHNTMSCAGASTDRSVVVEPILRIVANNGGAPRRVARLQSTTRPSFANCHPIWRSQEPTIISRAGVEMRKGDICCHDSCEGRIETSN